MDWEDSSPLPVNTSFAVLEGWSNGTPVSKVSCLNGFSNFNKIGKCHKAKTYLSTDGHLQRIRYSSHNKTNPQYLYNMHLSGTCGSSSCIHQYHLRVWQNENMITARSFGSVNYYFCERNVLIVIIVVRRQDEAEHDLQISSLGRFELFLSLILI